MADICYVPKDTKIQQYIVDTIRERGCVESEDLRTKVFDKIMESWKNTRDSKICFGHESIKEIIRKNICELIRQNKITKKQGIDVESKGNLEYEKIIYTISMEIQDESGID
jgi:hypothetical protein